MKLSLVISGLDTGGAEMMLLKVLERLGPGFSPHVISLTPRIEIGPRIRALGIPVESLGMHPGIPDPRAILRLARRLRELKPDVVHTWMYHADLLGGLAARLAGMPAVGWAIHHSNLSPAANKRSTLAVARACSRLSHCLPDRILCCSEVARKVHVEYGYATDKMMVVPNGFDLSLFRPDRFARNAVRQELGLDPDVPLVGLIGRFDPQKNHAGFLQAAGLLHRKMSEVHFLLAGKGVDRGNAKLLQGIEESDLHGFTHLLGLRTDVPRLMAALDVLVSSSIGEAFPNVLGEAMGCCVPCAVTDVGDSAWIVGDTGWVVPVGDMAGLAKAMEELLAMPPAERKILGERARTRVSEKFEIGSIVEQYKVFYAELAALGQKRRDH